MKKILILTGAGISQESGIPTFRDSKGLWEENDIKKVASLEGYAADPEFVHSFYNERRKKALLCEPNDAHRAIYELSRHYDVSIITQNVDNLHEKAGSKDVIHLHGSLFSMKCKGAYINNKGCGKKFPFLGEWKHNNKCPYCGTVGTVRPDIVWFNEALDENTYSWSLYYAEQADLFVQIGTSGEVYPANLLYQCVPIEKRILINMEDTDQSKEERTKFNHKYIGKATSQVPLFCSEIEKYL